MMQSQPMTPLERVLTTLSHKEPDRVPILYTFTLHGAKITGVPIKEYFSKPEYVVEGQYRLREKFRHDLLYSFFYASVEVEAWGAEIIYVDDGPPNAGEPFLKKPEMIRTMEVPNVRQSPSLVKVLEATEQLRARVGNDVPIVGVVMAPPSLPVMQLGFDHYIELMYEQPALFQQLMRINEEFCIEWGNAQLEAGATAIGYFDPVSSPTIIPLEMYLENGYEIAKRVFARFKGPAATLYASGSVLPAIEHIKQTGSPMVGASAMEDLATLKAACQGSMTVIGNLNAIEMCRWTPAEAEAEVKKTLASAARGGGFILCDNHGEIPWQVPDEVLLAITEATETWGTYPLDWIDNA